MSKHPVVHVEFATTDREAAGQFFGELFGWQIRQIPEMSYATFSSGENEVGGGFTPAGEGTPPGKVVVYVNTDDIDATLLKAEQMGGRCLQPKMEIPTVGWFAVISDPSGVEVALLQPLEGSM